METIRFDDIEKLKSKVSQEFSASSKPIEVTQEKINQCADVTGDHQRDPYRYRTGQTRESVQSAGSARLPDA